MLKACISVHNYPCDIEYKYLQILHSWRIVLFYYYFFTLEKIGSTYGFTMLYCSSKLYSLHVIK